MKIIKPSVEVLTPINGTDVLKVLELAGRTCYKSEGKITEDSCVKFVQNVLSRGHEAVIEHFNITVKFICDRGVTHEIVRHRLASYCQESTRYCNYSKDVFGNEITVIEPCFWSYIPNDNTRNAMHDIWVEAMDKAEKRYFELLSYGATPQEARSVLPNSLKTELVMTANMREWRHFLKLRTSKAAHPQMREVAIMLLNQLKEKIPILFDDIEVDA